MTMKPADDPKALQDILLHANWTDLGNAECFEALFDRHFKYCDALGGWLWWDGVRWLIKSESLAHRAAAVVPRKRYNAGKVLTDPAERAKFARFTAASENINRITAALRLAQHRERFAAVVAQFDASPALLGSKNLTLNLTTGEAHQPNPQQWLTRVAGTTFDPAAKAPRWERFLNEVFANDQDLIGFIQRSVGYSLTGDTREQKFWLLHGHGANGKSTFFSVLEWLAGDYFATASFSLFDMGGRDREAKITLAQFRGKRLLTVSEVNEDRPLNEERIKAITGVEPIECRDMYSKPFSYLPAFKVWMAMNHKPVIKGQDYGTWRRVMLVPFSQTFDETRADSGLRETLRAELPGILNWALAGAVAWQKQGLGIPRAVLDATAAYKAESDVIGLWMHECAEIDETTETQASIAYASYKAWCEQNEHRPMSITNFGKEIVRDRGITKRVARHIGFYTGLLLLDV